MQKPSDCQINSHAIRVQRDSIEGLCLLLRHLAYPCHYVDLITLFGHAKQEISIISNLVLDAIYSVHKHLLNTFTAPWMSPRNLAAYCEAIHDKGAALDNCWGFVDGTVSSSMYTYDTEIVQTIV